MVGFKVPDTQLDFILLVFIDLLMMKRGFIALIFLYLLMDYVTSHSIQYVVMPWVNDNLSLTRCLFACSHCIQQILEAVLHCHQMGVVHRDLKVSTVDVQASFADLQMKFILFSLFLYYSVLLHPYSTAQLEMWGNTVCPESKTSGQKK